VAYWVAGRSYLAARVWFCFLSAATCVLLGLLGARLFGRATGILAAGLLAATPAHWYYALHLVSELPYSLLITAAVVASVAAWQAERDSARLAGAIGGGVLYAAAALVRPQAIFAVPSAVLLFLAASPETRRRSGRFLVVALLAFATVTGAWVVRNARVVGHPTFAGIGSLTFWGAHNERVLTDPALCGSWLSVRELLQGAGIARPADEGQLVTLAWQQGAAFVRAHAADLPRLEVCKLRQLSAVFLDTPNPAARIAFAAAWLFTAPLALAGLVAAWRRNRAEASLALVPLLALLLAALVFYGSIRFRHSTEPLLVLFAARGLTALRRGDRVE
jgi:4-amino-4-deoxy-L-arabinose transferase-like glycosyltransferase